jgi:peptidoglycan/LPS O-acetylase OafA/YrhL
LTALASPSTAAHAPAASRIPSLDGVRGISILLVVIGHMAGTRGFLSEALARALNLGEFGVRVFFVISGYLITTLLISEHRKSGTVSLSAFYWRRVYRIFPAFYAYLAVVLGLAAAGLVELLPGDAIHAATFTMNHHHERAWIVGHLWSLSVEEQFYLCWPTVVLLLGPRRAMWVAGAAVVLAPAIRVVAWFRFPETRLGIGETFPTIFDSIAVGCLLAGLRERLSNETRYLRALGSPAAMILPIVAFGASLLYRRPSVYLPFGHTVANVAIALWIDRLVRFPERDMGRLVNTRALTWVGTMSYSIYLWQQPFLDRTSSSVLASFPLNLALTFVAALASYHLVEQTFLRIRARRMKG